MGPSKPQQLALMVHVEVSWNILAASEHPVPVFYLFPIVIQGYIGSFHIVGTDKHAKWIHAYIKTA